MWLWLGLAGDDLAVDAQIGGVDHDLELELTVGRDMKLSAGRKALPGVSTGQANLQFTGYNLHQFCGLGTEFVFTDGHNTDGSRLGMSG